MPVPRFCSNPRCANSRSPEPRWRQRYGSYRSAAHGRVQRYRCRRCGRTVSTQSESMHYFAKRRLALRGLWQAFLCGASLRELSRLASVSPQAMQGVILRLGRQAMAAQAVLLTAVCARRRVVLDGLRSVVSSADYPCELTTVVEPQGETILSVGHSITRRGGTLTAAQRRRCAQKYARWRPARGSMREAISSLYGEIWDYLRPPAGAPAVIDTDELSLYHAVLAADRIFAHFRRGGLIAHRRTPATAPRTVENRLFAVNYVDRLLRHRVREHTRESIAIGRHAVMQMHRMWIFAWDHNAKRPWRVRRPREGVHAARDAVPAELTAGLGRQFFSRRIRLAGTRPPESIRRVWAAELATPPHRWRAGQAGTTVVPPAYALRDLAAAYQQAR